MQSDVALSRLVIMLPLAQSLAKKAILVSPATSLHLLVQPGTSGN